MNSQRILHNLAFAFSALSFAAVAIFISSWIGALSELRGYATHPGSGASFESLLWLFASVIIFVFLMPLIYLFVIRGRREDRFIYYIFVVVTFAILCGIAWINGIVYAPYFVIFISIIWVFFFEYSRWIDADEARALPALIAGIIALAVGAAVIMLGGRGQRSLLAPMLAAWLIPLGTVILTDFFRPRTGVRRRRPDQTGGAG